LGKVPDNPNKIAKYLGKIPEKLGKKWHPTLFDFEKWLPTFSEKQAKTIFLEVTPKNGRQMCMTTFCTS